MNLSATVSDCSLIQLPRETQEVGNVTGVVSGVDLPFRIARVFYIYDIPGGQDRGAHAHRWCHQVLVALSGSFDVELDDCVTRRCVTLNRPFIGLHIPPGIWAVEKRYSSGALCLALASHVYEEADYIRDHEEYRKLRCTLPG